MVGQQVDRITDLAFEAGNATALHLRRIADAVVAASARTVQEVSDLAWQYRDLASDVRRSRRNGNYPDGQEKRVIDGVSDWAFRSGSRIKYPGTARHGSEV